MDPPQRIYRGAVRTLSFVFVAVGAAILISTFTHDGDALSLGLFLGIGFIGIGVTRLWISGSPRDRTRGQVLLPWISSRASSPSWNAA